DLNDDEPGDHDSPSSCGLTFTHPVAVQVVVAEPLVHVYRVLVSWNVRHPFSLFTMSSSSVVWISVRNTPCVMAAHFTLSKTSARDLRWRLMCSDFLPTRTVMVLSALRRTLTDFTATVITSSEKWGASRSDLTPPSPRRRRDVCYAVLFFLSFLPFLP